MIATFQKNPTFTQKLKELVQNFEQFLINAADVTQNQYKHRIFTQGLNPYNEKIQEGYSEKWAEVRQDAGLQIQFVDMNYTGDLKKNTYFRVEGKELLVIINQDYNYIKVTANEEGKGPIIDLSKDEIQTFVNQIRLNLKKYIQNM
jgi:hypothetical protein